MANKELMITLGLDATTFTQKIKKAKDLNKELDKSFELLSSSSKNFENTIQGLSKKQEYLNQKMELASKEANIYAERLTECQKALEESQKDAEKYAKEVERLSEIQERVAKNLGTSSKMYETVSQKLKEKTQLLDKANKAWIANDKRVTEASVGYKNAQVAVQEFGREAVLVSEKMSAMRADEEMNDLSEAIKESQRSFENMKNSVVGFDNTMEGLDKTQTHYTNQIEKMNELISKQKSELSASKKVLNDYEDELSRLNIQMAEYDEIMATMDGTENMFNEVRAEAEALRLEYSSLNKTIEFHKERVNTLSNEYKSNETTLAKFNQCLDASTKKMVEMNNKVTFEPVSKQIKELTNSTITKLENKLAELNDEFEIATTTINGLEDTVTGLTVKKNQLNKTLEVSKNILSEYKKELTTIKSETQKLTNEQKELEEEITKQISLLQKLKGAEWDKQAKSIENLKARYEEVNKSLDLHNKRVKTLENGYTSSRKNVAELTKELEQVKKEIENLNRASKFDILDKNIKSVSQEIQKLDDAFEVAKSSIINFERTQEGLSKTTEHYTQKLSLLKRQMETYSDSIKHNEQEISRLKKEYEELADTYSSLRIKLATLDKTSPEYNETLMKLADLQSKMKEVRNETERLADSNNELQSELSQTRVETNELTLAQSRLSAEFKANKFQNLGSKLTSLGSGISAIGNSLMGATYASIGAMTAIGKTGIEFDAQMSKVGALTGDTGEKLEQTMVILEEGARRLAETSKFSATEMAQGLEDLVLAGYNAEQAVETLPLAMQFAQAGTIELATATEDLIMALSSLGDNSELVGTDLENMTVMANQIALVANATTTDLDGVARSLLKVGGQVENMNIPLSTASTMIGILGDKGTLAEEAGNALNSILINLTQTTGQSSEAMKELGLSCFDAEGNIRPIEKVLGELKQKLESFQGDEQEIILSNMLGGKTQAKTLQKLLQGIDSQTGDFTEKYKTLKTELEGTIDLSQLENGKTALEAMAEAMNDNLKGDIANMTSALEEGAISIFERYEPQLREFVQKITGAILEITEKIRNLTPKQMELIASIAKWSVVAPMALKVIGGLTSGVGELFDKVGKAYDLFKDTKSVVNAGKALEGVSFFSNLAGKAILAMGGSISGATIAIGAGIVAFVAIATAIGNSETAISSLIDKLGWLGTTVAGICEFIAGAVQLVVGNIFNIISGLGKGIVALLTGKWWQIDDIFKETWSKVENTTAEAWSNLKLETTRGINKLQDLTTDGAQTIVNTYEETIKGMSGITLDTVGDVAKDFSNKFKDLDKDTLTILRGTSDQMSIIFEGIKEGMDLEDAEKKFTANLESLVKSGKFNLSELENEFADAQKMMETHLKDGSTKIKNEGQKIVDELGKIGQFSAESVSTNVARVVKSMDTETFEALRKMGGNWSKMFEEVKDVGTTSVEDLTEILCKKIKELKFDTPEGLAKLEEEIKNTFKSTANDVEATVDEMTKSTSEAFATMVGVIKDNSETGIDEVTKIFAEGLSTLDAETLLSLKNTSDHWYSILNGAVDDSGVLIDNFAQQILWNLGWVSEQSPEKLQGFKDELLKALVEANLITDEEMKAIVDKVSEGADEVVDAISGAGYSATTNVQQDADDIVDAVSGAGYKVVEELEKSVDDSVDAVSGAGQVISDNLTPKNTAEAVKEELDAITGAYHEKTANITEASAKAGEEAQKKFDEKVSQLGKDIQVDSNIINIEALGTQFQNAGALAVQNFVLGWSNNNGLITEAIDLALSTVATDLSAQFEVINLNIDGVAQKAVILNDKVIELKESISLLDGIGFSQLSNNIDNTNEGIKQVLKSSTEAKTEIANLGKTSIKNLIGELDTTNKNMIEVKDSTVKASTEVQNLNNKNVNKVTEQINKFKTGIDKSKDSLTKLIKELDKFLEKSFDKIHSRIDGINSRITTAIDKSVSLKNSLNELNYISFDSLINRLASVNSWLSSVKNSAWNTSYAIQEVKTPRILNYEDANIEPLIDSNYLNNLARTPFDINKYQTRGGYYSPNSMAGTGSKALEAQNQKDQLAILKEQNDLLRQLLLATNNIGGDLNVKVDLDGREVARTTAKYMEAEISNINKRKNRLGGLL